MRTLDFYFDYRSPYTFLALSQLRQMDVEIVFRPFEIGALMKLVGNVPSIHYGVPLNRHPQASEFDVSRLLRATLVAGQLGAMPAAVKAIFNAFWSAPAPLATATEVAALLGAEGLDAKALESQMDDPAAHVLLEEATAEAAARGVFGSPTMFVGDEMFFGNDRLHFVRDRLARAA